MQRIHEYVFFSLLNESINYSMHTLLLQPPQNKLHLSCFIHPVQQSAVYIPCYYHNKKWQVSAPVTYQDKNGSIK